MHVLFNCTHHPSEIRAHPGAQKQPAKQTPKQTPPIFPTKDVPLLMKRLLMSAPCTRDSYATVASAPSQNLDKGTWAGVWTNSACSQPTFKHCQKYHLMFCGWVIFVGDSCWLFPVSLGFVLLSIVRIKATWAQLGTSEVTNPYLFLLILTHSC